MWGLGIDNMAFEQYHSVSQQKKCKEEETAGTKLTELEKHLESTDLRQATNIPTCCARHL